MSSPPHGYGRKIAGTALGALLLCSIPAAAQQPPDQVPQTGLSLVAEAVIGAVVTLLVGGGLVALAPDYTERTTDRILEQPGEAFLYGLGLFVAGLVLVVLLAITIIGFVLVIPLVIAAVVISVLGYLATGRAVTDDWPGVLLVAVLVGVFVNAVPFLGGLVGFVLSCLGFGAWYLDYRDDGGRSSGGSSGVEPATDRTAGETTPRGDASEQWGTGRNTGETADSADGDDYPTSDDTDGPDEDHGDSGDDAADDDPGDSWTAGFDDRE